MTRKRFVKLLMARGYSRSEIDSFVNRALKNGMSYADAYLLISSVPRIVVSWVDKLSKSLRKAEIAIKSFAKSMRVEP